jgi:hypothetical protein
MSHPKIDNPPKTHISHRAHREHGDILLKLSFYSQVLFCRKQENLFVSLCLCVRSWLRLCERPKPFNHVMLFLFLTILLAPLHSCNAKDEASPDPADNVILYENWEKKNFKNWEDDFRKGDATIDSDPVYQGKYALKQRASEPGSLVHFFGDHPGVNKKTVDAVTLESYLYLSIEPEWPFGLLVSSVRKHL